MKPDEALKILGLNEKCSDADVKQRFRKLAKKAHPDNGGSEAQMKQLNEAHKCLIEWLPIRGTPSDPLKQSKQNTKKPEYNYRKPNTTYNPNTSRNNHRQSKSIFDEWQEYKEKHEKNFWEDYDFGYNETFGKEYRQTDTGSKSAYSNATVKDIGKLKKVIVDEFEKARNYVNYMVMLYRLMNIGFIALIAIFLDYITKYINSQYTLKYLYTPARFVGVALFILTLVSAIKRIHKYKKETVHNVEHYRKWTWESGDSKFDSEFNTFLNIGNKKYKVSHRKFRFRDSEIKNAWSKFSESSFLYVDYSKNMNYNFYILPKSRIVNKSKFKGVDFGADATIISISGGKHLVILPGLLFIMDGNKMDIEALDNISINITKTNIRFNYEPTQYYTDIKIKHKNNGYIDKHGNYINDTTYNGKVSVAEVYKLELKRPNKREDITILYSSPNYNWEDLV